MKWWEVLLICTWPSSIGITALVAWLNGHKAGREFAYRELAKSITRSRQRS